MHHYSGRRYRLAAAALVTRRRGDATNRRWLRHPDLGQKLTTLVISKQILPRRSRRLVSAIDRGCAKTKSDLVVMPSEKRIFAVFCSERDHKPQNSGCGYTAQSFHTAWVIKSPQLL